MVAAGEHHAFDTLLARGFIQVVCADDVGLQDGVPGLLGRHTTQVHHGIHAFQQVQHGARIFEARWAHFFARCCFAQFRNVRQPQGGAIGLQARAQLAAQPTGGSGQQKSFKSDRRRVTGHGNHRGSWYSGDTLGCTSSVVVQRRRNVPLLPPPPHRDNTKK
ncbi:hypothetical protein D3C71_1618780 [compost metagenome]